MGLKPLPLYISNPYYILRIKLKTDIKKIHAAVAEIDPKGESEELNMALFVISLAMEKEYTDYELLVKDANEKYEEYYGVSYF